MSYFFSGASTVLTVLAAHDGREWLAVWFTVVGIVSLFGGIENDRVRDEKLKNK